MKPILVQKFGGTSVDTPEHRQMAADKVAAARDSGFAPVVVVSAIGRAGAPYATDTLIQELMSVAPDTKPKPRELDLMMACGEIISTVIMAQTLESKGIPAIALTGGQAGIITDYEFGNARILSIDPGYLFTCIERGQTPVVAGFQGVTEPHGPGGGHGAITTLGRGGSDTTASALGAALQAQAVEIYTDVPGVMTADPRLVPEARPLEIATYEEISEMAHLGARVLHPRAAQIAMDYNIPLWVKSTFTDDRGTLIKSRSEVEFQKSRITGIAHTSKVVWVEFLMGEACHWPRVQLEVYKLLGRARVPIHLVTILPSGFGFAVQREDFPTVKELLNGLVIPMDVRADGQCPCGSVYLIEMEDTPGLQGQKELLERATSALRLREVKTHIEENGALVSVIVLETRNIPGLMAQVVGCLYQEGIPIFQTADSNYSISCLIHEGDLVKAVRALHRHFRLHEGPYFIC